MGDGRAQPVHKSGIFLNRVAPFHTSQDPIRGGLERQVEIRGDLVTGRHGVNGTGIHIGRMRRGKTNPLNPIDARGLAQEAAKIDLAIPVGVDGLAQIDDFFIPLVGKCANLVQQRRRGHTALPPADVGHDAEGTELVAAPHDRHPCSYPFPTCGRNIGIGFIPVEADGHQRLINTFLRQQGRQVTIGVRSQHQIKKGGFIEQGLPMMLGHAAGEPQDDTRLPGFMFHQITQSPDDALFRPLPNRASIQQDDIGAVRRRLRFVSVRLQQAQDELGVSDIHLTAVGFNIDATCFHACCPSRAPSPSPSRGEGINVNVGAIPLWLPVREFL